MASDKSADGTVVLLPHLGLGDMLVLRGMVAALCESRGRVVVVCFRKYRGVLSRLFEDLAPKVALAVVDSTEAGRHAAEFLAKEHQVLALGDHSGTPDWRGLDPQWTRALYLNAGMDPDLMHTGFKLPTSREAASRDMLATVRRLTGGRPYVLVHDDPARPLVMPEVPSGTEVLHVDDARFASDCLFDYVDVLRHATQLHAIDSCFALLVHLARLGTPVAVHSYSKGEREVVRTFPPGVVDIVRVPPTPARYGAHKLPDDEVGRALKANFRHLAALLDLMAPTRATWHPCGTYLMGPSSMDYEPSMHAKQAMFFRAAKGCRNALEIGVHGGHSLLLMLLASPDAHITCVDVCEWEHTSACVAYLQAQFPGRITMLKGASRDVLPLLQDSFDMVHVDGDHSYASARFDMEQAHRLSHPSTAFVFDDYCDGIARAVSDLSHLYEVVDVPSCAWANCLARRRDGDEPSSRGQT